jgi:hypothetical protein
VTTASGYLEMFAVFFVGASEAEAHYYSIKPLHKDIPDLARLLGASQDNFQALLVASGLGSLWKNGQFVFKKRSTTIGPRLMRYSRSEVSTERLNLEVISKARVFEN